MSLELHRKAKHTSAPHAPPTHSAHLAKHPDYPPRAEVKHISWDVPEPSYKPVEFTHKSVLENDRTVKPGGWADPAALSPSLIAELKQRTSNALEPGGKVQFGVDGRPRNPIGRTGMTGRGLLGKWGPNYAADPVVTRFDPEHGTMQMVVIQRKDTKAWAIPGGMVDDGEAVSKTLKREFEEEANAESNKEEISEKLNDLFANKGELIFIGYVDDPRNTDNAWMETTAVHFHIGDSVLAHGLTLNAGDDAQNVRWLDIDDSKPEFKNLYASHRSLVLRALNKFPESWGHTLEKVDMSSI